VAAVPRARWEEHTQGALKERTTHRQRRRVGRRSEGGRGTGSKSEQWLRRLEEINAVLTCMAAAASAAGRSTRRGSTALSGVRLISCAEGEDAEKGGGAEGGRRMRRWGRGSKVNSSCPCLENTTTNTLYLLACGCCQQPPLPAVLSPRTHMPCSGPLLTRGRRPQKTPARQKASRGSKNHTRRVTIRAEAIPVRDPRLENCLGRPPVAEACPAHPRKP
jgi:hypothetical protein